MMKKKILASAITATLASAVFNVNANAVTISNTDVGQVLLGEMYLVRDADYTSTRITVINTETTQAVKAKLVFRSKLHSDECKDVILYLTPGDVAYVDVKKDASGAVVVESDDDSILTSRKSDGTLRFASQEKFSSAMVAPRTEPAADTCAQGHVEVIAAYAAQGSVAVATGNPVTVTQGMSKFDLIRIFDTAKSDLNARNAGLCRVTNDGSAGCDGANFDSRVSLLGTVEIKSANDRLLSNMVALESGSNAHTAGTVTHNVTNTAFDVTVGAETLIGQGKGVPADAGIVNGSDKLYDIEGALKTTRLFNHYTRGGTSFEVTFPTKYRHLDTAVRYSGRFANTGYTAPFTPAGHVVYSNALYDTQERSAPGTVSDVCIVSPCTVSVTPVDALIHEVNYEVLSGTANWNPALGWFRFAFTNQAGVDTVGTGRTWVAGEGVPAVGYAHYYQSAPGSALGNSVVSRLGR